MLAAGKRTKDGGATLLEMLVVVALMGLISALVFPSLDATYARARAQAVQASLTTSLRDARAQALRSQIPVLFEADADGRGYRVAERRMRLPEGSRLDATPSVISFMPDGVASEARLTLQSLGQPPFGLLVTSPSGLVEGQR